MQLEVHNFLFDILKRWKPLKTWKKSLVFRGILIKMYETNFIVDHNDILFTAVQINSNIIYSFNLHYSVWIFKRFTAESIAIDLLWYTEHLIGSTCLSKLFSNSSS